MQSEQQKRQSVYALKIARKIVHALRDVAIKKIVVGQSNCDPPHFWRVCFMHFAEPRKALRRCKLRHDRLYYK
jgi:hypothetical protein